MSKHTPGPWIVRQCGGNGYSGQKGYAIDFNEDQEQVADFVYEEADAHLIAAAPDLLEALQEIAEYPALDALEMKRIARNAIAKARGEA